MAAARKRERELTRFIYVTRFGSHQCLTQKTLAKTFDFPIPFNEASKIMKKRKKVSAWKKVHKVISRMLKENEKYRLRLKCQQLSSESSDYTR